MQLTVFIFKGIVLTVLICITDTGIIEIQINLMAHYKGNESQMFHGSFK